jgi:hypothetical protein
VHTWRTVWDQASTAAITVVNNRRNAAQDIVRRVIGAQKPALKSVHTAFTAGRIDKPTFTLLLREERRSMEAELRASPGIGHDTAHASARAFFAVMQREASDGSRRRT